MKRLLQSVLLVVAGGVFASGLLFWSTGLAQVVGAPAAGDPPVAASASGALERGTSAGSAREKPKSIKPREIAAAAEQGDEPNLSPPVRTDSEALEGAEPRLAGAPRTVRVCPHGHAQPNCRHTGLQAALDAALPGDHLVLAPGVYEEGAIITTPSLVLRGEPGAHLRGRAVEGKAALVVKADDVLIEGVECSGVRVRDNNGACIRIEGDDLTVRNVHFHDNQQGILSGPGGGVLLVENSLFERNGFGGQAHGVYIGPTIETFIFRNNRTLATTGAGHGFKSRAQRTIIEDNVIASLDGHDSRAIDVPNGGEVVIRGNVLEKGPNSENGQMIGLALEGKPHDVNETLIENNLFLFDTLTDGLIQDLARAVGLLPLKGTVIHSRSPGRVVLRDNTIVGARDIGGDDVIDQDNRVYDSRRGAGLPPYPVIPERAP